MTARILLFPLVILVAPANASAEGPVLCTDHHGMYVKCSGEVIYDLLAQPQRDGTSNRVAWKQYVGELDQWRQIALYDTGQTHFVLDPGGSNARNWLTFSHWIFPRTRGLKVSKYPGEMRFEVTDSTGMLWILKGTSVAAYKNSFVVERIGEAPQESIGLGTSALHVTGVDLTAAKSFYLEHRRPDFKAYTNYQKPKYLRMKSVIHDRKGRTCRVKNGELFDPMPNPKDVTDHIFKFDNDEKLIAFLAERCPKLDLAPLKVPKIEAAPPRKFNKGRSR